MSISPLVDRVRTTLEHLGRGSSVEEVMELCPELTCNEIFLAIDHLNRTGTVQVTVDADRTCRIQTVHLVGK